MAPIIGHFSLLRAIFTRRNRCVLRKTWQRKSRRLERLYHRDGSDISAFSLFPEKSGTRASVRVDYKE
jgi:hypothetical protein